jgi:predicted acyltransferase
MEKTESPAPQLGAVQAPQPTERVFALDALRGFDMMWIVGADAVGSALSQFRGGAAARIAAAQLDHSPWAGLRFYDLIFPLFVFMVGVAIPYSLDKIVASGGRPAAVRRILLRTALLYLLGIFYSGGFSAAFDQIRLLGVLQRIALSYCGASLLYLWLRPRGLWAVFAGLLVGYWALMTFIPVPGFGAGDFAEGHNLANWIDAHYLPFRKYDGDHDPEGLLSAFPAVGTCLLGVFAGRWIKDPGRSSRAKVGLLAVVGCALLAAGFLWSLQFPVIKKVWTSSFVLVVGGWSMLLLAVFYQVTDVWRLRRGLQPFVWLGSNSLTIYLASNIVDFGRLSARFAGGAIAGSLNALWPGLGALVLALTSIVLCMLLCGFLYRRRIFLRL